VSFLWLPSQLSKRHIEKMTIKIYWSKPKEALDGEDDQKKKLLEA
jgi:hypothetical protein